jgi:hypothetical protein
MGAYAVPSLHYVSPAVASQNSFGGISDMAVTQIGSSFVVKALNGSGLWNYDILMNRIRSVDGAGTDFAIGIGTTSNFDPVAMTYDLKQEGIRVLSATSTETAAVQSPDTLATIVGSPDGNNYAFRALASGENGGYVALLNAGADITSTSFSLVAVTAGGVVSTLASFVPAANQELCGKVGDGVKNAA